MAELDTLKQYLDSAGEPLTLAAGDPQLPAQLSEFLAAMPVSTVTITLDAGGVVLSGGVLTVSGAVAAQWPVTGLGGADPVTVPVTHLTLTVTETMAADGTVTIAAAATAQGTLTVGDPIDVVLTSVPTRAYDGSPLTAWQLTPATAAQVSALQLFDLGYGAAAGAPGPLAGLPVLPPAFQLTASVAPGDLTLTFYPGTAYAPLLGFTVQVPDAQWTVITGMLELDGVTVQAAIGPRRWLAGVIGTIVVGGVAMRIGVRINEAAVWTASARPADGPAFPGLAALAAWAGGQALTSGAESGLAALNLDAAGLDAAISDVELAFDINALTLSSVRIGTLVALGALRFDVVLSLPDLRVAGSLHNGDPVRAVDVLTSLGLPAAGLPSALSISRASFAADLAKRNYTANLTLSDVWTVGPVTLQQLALSLGRTSWGGLSGSVLAQFDIGASITLGLEAEYVDDATGWSFEGTMWNSSEPVMSDLIGALNGDYGISAVPAPLQGMTLTYVTASFQTGTGDLAFGATGDFQIAGATATLEVGIAITSTARASTGPDTTVGTAGYAAKFSGTLTIGSLTFQVAFDTAQRGGDVRLAAHWAAPDDQTFLGFADLAEALGLPAPAIPEGLDLRLKAADFSYNVSKGELLIAAQSETYGNAVFVALPAPDAGSAGSGAAGTEPAGSGYIYAFAVAIGHPIDLSDIPLLGEALGEDDTCAVEDIQAVVSSEPLSAATAAAANALVPTGYPTFPAQGTAAQVALSAVMRFGEQTIPLALGTAPASASGSTAGASAPALAPAPSGTTVGASSGAGGVVARPAAAADGTVWFRVEKAFGPLTVSRIGARYAEGALWFALDASLEAGGLSLVLQGASVGSPVTTFAPRFDLRGLTVDFAEPPLAIGGGFGAVAPTGGADFQYDGSAVVSAATWSALAFGSYAEVNGNPSMFLFLKAAGSFGGPPAFFVTALAGGFGYNSTVRIPTAEQVADFPLVAGLADPARLGGPNGTPAQALAALSGGPDPWISPAPGQTWLAAGVRFTTFQQLDSTALLLVEFGNGLTVLLLGVSTARFPNSTAQRPYAQIELQLRALFRPDDGFLGVTAVLTRNSFLIDPACVLTGGFAFYMWFGESEHAGDFVVALGGYHPAFTPPAHYPVVPRVGFSWSLDSAITISGSAYFALTPSAIMAGGSLDVRYHDGNLTAWFTAHADLIVTWSPFHFRAGIGVSIGVNYEMNLLFTTQTLHLEAGADLTLWGPPTGGTVTVRLWIITFTVAFGAPENGDPQPLDWPGFQALLPAPAAGTTFAAAAGLAAPAGDNAERRPVPNQSTVWAVRADGFVLTLRNAVPSTNVFLGSAAKPATLSGDTVNIRPMRRTGLTVNQRVVLTRTQGASPGEVDVTGSCWSVTSVVSNVPKALWGTGDGSSLDAGDAQLVPGQLTGLTLTAPRPTAGWSAGPIDAVSVLGVVQIPPGGPLPLDAAAQPVGKSAAHGDAVSAISGRFASQAAQSARTALFADLAALGSAPTTNGPVSRFAASAGTEFADQPLLAGTAL